MGTGLGEPVPRADNESDEAAPRVDKGLDEPVPRAYKGLADVVPRADNGLDEAIPVWESNDDYDFVFSHDSQQNLYEFNINY